MLTIGELYYHAFNSIDEFRNKLKVTQSTAFLIWFLHLTSYELFISISNKVIYMQRKPQNQKFLLVVALWYERAEAA